MSLKPTNGSFESVGFPSPTARRASSHATNGRRPRRTAAARKSAPFQTGRRARGAATADWPHGRSVIALVAVMPHQRCSISSERGKVQPMERQWNEATEGRRDGGTERKNDSTRGASGSETTGGTVLGAD